jgi:hypothetical protein
MDTYTYRPLRYRQRWFCYLDLLGFTALVQTKKIDEVIPLYQNVLRELRQQAKLTKRPGLIYSWFSDTFIIYSRDDTEKEFSHVEQVGRLFFQKLIMSHIPVRAALTHGELYSQSLQNTFVGPALIDAYNYAESQDWLGFILTPKVFQRLENTPLALTKRPHYRLVAEPGIIRCAPAGPVYAFAFNNGISAIRTWRPLASCSKRLPQALKASMREPFPSPSSTRSDIHPGKQHGSRLLRFAGSQGVRCIR